MTRGSSVRLPRERLIALSSLLALAALAWVYLFHQAQSMHAVDMLAMAARPVWTADSVITTFLMWSVMMIGMMLPSAAPAILLYQTLVRENAKRGSTLPAVWTFTAGYIAAWSIFSIAATLMQLTMRSQSLLNMSMESTSLWLSSASLLAAGLYQWLPLKHICLEKCRSPMQFFMGHWRAGRLGALRMGLEHGWFCIGCCWALMLLLFVAGVMNLLWVALIAGFVFAEKLLPGGRLTSRFAGIGLLLSGAGLLLLR